MGSLTAYAGRPGLAPPKIVCRTCTINGATTATVGQAEVYTLSSGTVATWTVTNGATIVRQTDVEVIVQFNNTGITNIETAGATCGGSSINVSVTAAPLTAPSISESSGTINYGVTPGTVSSSGASGGSCGTSYSYAWYYSTNLSGSGATWNLISGASGLSYQPGALTQTTSYEQIVTCSGATATSNHVTITVYSQLAGGSISPSTQTINYNTTPSTMTLSGVSGGSGTYTYQWLSSPNGSVWTTISGATGTSYTPPALTSTTYYLVDVTSNGVTVGSATAKVTVYSQLAGGSISPSTQTINYNTAPSTMTLSGVSGGSGAYTYQWQSSLNSSFSSPSNVGSGGTTYTPGALTSTTYYRVAVTSNGVTAYSSTAKDSVYSQLAGGSISPATQTINYNTAPSTMTLSGVSGGSGTYTYQWQSSSNSSFSSPTNVGSGTTTYSPGALTSTTYYRVAVISNGVTAYSSTAKDSVYSQLAGGSLSPSSQSINYNTTPSTLTLSGVSGGNSTYTYQWQSSPTSAFSSPTSVGSGTTTYSPGALTSTIYYRVAVTSNGVTTYSSTAEDSVYSQLVGGSLGPSTQTINYDSTPSPLTLTGASGGNGSYTYQWQSSPNSSFGSPTNVGSGGTTYSPGALTSTTYYRVAVTSNGVTSYSGTAEDSVYSQLTGGSLGPSTQTINYDSTPSPLTLTGASGGNGSYIYQWQSSPNSSFGSPTNVGSGGTTYSPGALTSTTYYRVAVTSNGVTVYSSIADDSVYSQLLGGSISPATQTINNGYIPSGLTLSGVSGGSGVNTYTWESSADPLFSTFTNVGTGSSYNPPSLTSTTYYRVYIVNGTGVTAYSASAVVNVWPPLVAGSVTPALSTIGFNSSPGTLTLTGYGGGNGSYVFFWFSSPDSLNWNFVSGTGGSTITPGDLTQTTYFRVFVLSNGVFAYSNAAEVIVTPVGGEINPTPTTLNYGAAPVTLTLSEVTGGNGVYSYQWYYGPSSNYSGGSPIADTGTSYVPSTTTPASGYYWVSVTSNGIQVNSTPAYFAVYNPVTPGTLSPATQTITSGVPSTLTLTGTLGGSGTGFTYQWQTTWDTTKPGNWGNITGQTTTSFTPPPATGTAYYRVVVYNNGGAFYSNTAAVAVNLAFSGGTISGPSGILPYNGSPGTLGSTQDAYGGSCYAGDYRYQWQYSTDGVNFFNLPGATSDTYTPTTPMTASLYFRRQVSCSANTINSNTIYIQVTPQAQTNCSIPN
jgi:hypothetical protein